MLGSSQPRFIASKEARRVWHLSKKQPIQLASFSPSSTYLQSSIVKYCKPGHVATTAVPRIMIRVAFPFLVADRLQLQYYDVEMIKPQTYLPLNLEPDIPFGTI